MKKKILLNSEKEEFNFERVGKEKIKVNFNNKVVEGFCLSKGSDEQFDVVNLNGKNIKVKYVGDYICIDGRNYKVQGANHALSKNSGGDSNMNSPMPGKILKVLVEVGDEVKLGQGLIVMEAMKMEHTIKASYDGRVLALNHKEGDLVDGGIELLELEVLEEK